MKRLFAILLCVSLLLGSVAFAAEDAASSVPRSDVTDTDAPTIIKMVFKENKKTLKAGDTIHVQMKVDDRSAVAHVNVQFYNESKEDWINLGLRYDAKTDMFVGEQKLTEARKNGTYIINYIDANDKYGNDAYHWDAKGMGSFKFTGQAKALKGTAKITENGKTVKPGDEIHVEVKLSKAVENVHWAYAAFALEGSPVNLTHHFPLTRESDKVYTSSFSFSDEYANGHYILKEVNFENDQYETIGSFPVSGQSVTLKGASDDKTPPAFSSVTLKEKGKTLAPGDVIHVSLKIKDASRVSWVSAGFTDGERIYCYNKDAKIGYGASKYGKGVEMTYNSSTKKWEGSLVLPENLPNGKFYMYFNAEDSVCNWIERSYEKLYFIYKGPDYVDAGIERFIKVCWNAIWGKDPTAAEIKKYGMPLASGKQNAAEVILDLMKKGKLAGEEAVAALYQIMQGNSDPSSTQVEKAKEMLDKGLDYAIDSLANADFRQRCENWGIVPGNLGTGKADTKVTGVTVDGGRYVFDGNTATFAGVTNKNVKKLVIKDTVEANGKTYKVTKIGSAACKGLKKLTTLVIGKNVKTIDPFAFSDCSKLKKITINAKKLKTVGVDSLLNISKKAAVKCPKGKAAKYEKLFRKNSGVPKSVKFQ